MFKNILLTCALAAAWKANCRSRYQQSQPTPKKVVHRAWTSEGFFPSGEGPRSVWSGMETGHVAPTGLFFISNL